jgi:hypothetical protein
LVGSHPRILRWFSLLFVAAIGVHQLRYLLGPGVDAQHSLGTHAHAYLPLAAAFVALLFGASVVHFVSTLALVRSGEIQPAKPLRFRSTWLRATLVLLAIFVGQESFEGALLHGHSSGMHGLFGHGGWMVLFLAPLFGALVALFLRGAQSALEAVARRALRCRRGRRLRARWPSLPDSNLPRHDVLAANLAGRAPPQLTS